MCLPISCTCGKSCDAQGVHRLPCSMGDETIVVYDVVRDAIALGSLWVFDTHVMGGGA